MKNNIIFRPVLVTSAILLIPLVTMQFTEEVNWTMSDFIVMGTLIFVTGILVELVLKKLGTYRIATAIAIILLFLWLWVELAVGLFTNWGS